MPWLNSFCAAGVHDVSKFTLPSCFALGAETAGCETHTTAAAVAVINRIFMDLSRVDLKFQRKAPAPDIQSSSERGVRRPSSLQICAKAAPGAVAKSIHATDDRTV